MANQVFSPRVADGDSSPGVDQQQRHRLADDVGATDDNRFLAAQINMAFFKHFHHAIRRTGNETRIALRQRTDVFSVEAIDILINRNRFEHGFFIEVFGQRQLHQNAVDIGIGVQLGNLFQHDLRVDRSIISNLLGMHADRQAAIDLVAHIDFGGRIGTDQNNHQAGAMPFGRQRINPRLEALTQLFSQRLAIDNLCRHRRIQQK